MVFPGDTAPCDTVMDNYNWPPLYSQRFLVHILIELNIKFQCWCLLLQEGRVSSVVFSHFLTLIQCESVFVQLA